MDVKLLPINAKDAIQRLYVACRTCYSKESPAVVLKQKTDTEKKIKLIEHALNSGHHSVLEHVSFTFLISGLSRVAAQQLTRHRIGMSFSMQSQRYCSLEDCFDYVVPDTIKANTEAEDLYIRTMGTLHDVYRTLLNLGIKAEDARMVLPNACTSNLTVSINLRQLIHVCHERLCTCAQLEIRQLVTAMVREVVKELPFLATYLVPKCEALGYCTENAKRTCKRKPLKKDVLP